MTKDELLELYDKVHDVVWNKNSWPNYCSYTITDPEISANESYLTFEVITHNDEYEDEWEEYWSIDNDGSICAGDEKYKDFEDFRYNW